MVGWPACALVGIAFACGLAVWMFGERVFRPAATVAMGFVGVLVGAVAAPLVWGGPATPFQVFLSAIGGMILGSVVGLIAYRWALAFGTGLLFASVCPVVVCVACSSGGSGGDGLDDWPAETARNYASTRADSWAAVTRAADDRYPGAGAAISTWLSNEGNRIWGRLARVLAGEEGSEVARLRALWSTRNQTHQGVIAAGAVVGLAVGIAFALLRPRWAGVVLTSAIGAAMWLPSLAWLSGALHAPWAYMIERVASLGPSLAIGIVIVGIVMQARGIVRAAA